MKKTWGYARVSTEDQNLARQLHAIKNYCPEIKDADIFQDKESGRNFKRKQYIKLKEVLREGDTLIVKDTSRIGRNKSEVKKELEWFKSKKVTLRILNIPTTLMEAKGNEAIMELVTALLIEVFTSLDEIDYDERRVKQAEGIKAAKERGVYKGRKVLKINKKQFVSKFELWDAKRIGITDVERMLNINRRTFYKKAREYRAYLAGKEKEPDWLI